MISNRVIGILILCLIGVVSYIPFTHAQGCDAQPVIVDNVPGVVAAEGDHVTATGQFYADKAFCLWFYGDDGIKLYDPAVAHDATSVTCEMPSRQIEWGPQSGTEIPECDTINLVIWSFNDGNTFNSDYSCYSHRGQHPSAWSQPGVSWLPVSFDCSGNTNECGVSFDIEEAFPYSVVEGQVTTVRLMAKPGEAESIVGQHAACVWWWDSSDPQGVGIPNPELDSYWYQNAVSWGNDEVECMTPSRDIISGVDSGMTIAPGDKARVTIHTWNDNDNKQLNSCYSHEGKHPNSWVAGDSAEVEYGTANQCATPPWLAAAAPSTGVAPGDDVTIVGNFYTHARCTWWYNDTPILSEQVPVSNTNSEVVCSVPDTTITVGPDAGIVIPPCAEINVTIHSWNNGDEATADTCYSHENEAAEMWDESTDWQSVQYACEPPIAAQVDGCLDGPAEMAFDSNFDLIVAQEGITGAGTSLALISAVSGAADAGDELANPFLDGFAGPAGVARVKQDLADDLLITDNMNGGMVHSWDNVAPHAPLSPSVGDPQSVFASGSYYYTANEVSGTISKFHLVDGFLCNLISGLSQPAAVHLSGNGFLYFTDGLGNLYEVDPGWCPPSPFTCEAAPFAGSPQPDCRFIAAVGPALSPPAAAGERITHGGLTEKQGRFFIPVYNRDVVARVDNNVNPATVSICITEVPTPRDVILAPGNVRLFITSFTTGHVYVADAPPSTCVATPAVQFTTCEKQPPAPAAGSAQCVEEPTTNMKLLYFQGVAVTPHCDAARGCHPDSWATIVEGVKYYSLGKASDLGLQPVPEGGCA